MALNPATSIPAMLLSQVAAHAAETVLRKKDRGIWTAVTWAELGARVRQVATGLQADGFGHGDAVCVLADTRPEWVTIDLGILAAGGISVGVPPTDSAAQLGHVLRESGACLLFVENEEQLDKALLAREACPALRRIVMLEMKGLRDFADPMCESWQDFLARGAAGDNSDDAAWRDRVAAIGAEQSALLVFASDGAGQGQALTHGDALQLVADAVVLLRPRAGDERLAVLPMAHVMERVLGLYFALSSRIISNYLENPATLGENLQELQPTVLGADPLTWERLHARAEQAAAGATRLQQVAYRWAIRLAGRGGLSAAVVRWLVLRAVRRELGLARLRLAYVGAAPLSPEVSRWAAALGIAVQQIDGHGTQQHAMEADDRALKAAYST